MKGIVLAGGSGTRLYPLTAATNKQLLPVYDKPMVYYPLSVLMLAGLREVLVISTERDLPRFEALLGDGSRLGMRISYKAQPKPDGLAQAFLVGEDFIDGDSCALVLGDNVFYEEGLVDAVRSAARKTSGATIFATYVDDPERFGVVEFDGEMRVVSIKEKPEHPRSNYAVTGLYFYDSWVCEFARRVERSERGEYEITDLNCLYLDDGSLGVHRLREDSAWLDAGTPESLRQAGEFVRQVEQSRGIKIAALEEIAFCNGWIGMAELEGAAEKFGNSAYGRHLGEVALRERRVSEGFVK